MVRWDAVGLALSGGEAGFGQGLGGEAERGLVGVWATVRLGLRPGLGGFDLGL